MRSHAPPHVRESATFVVEAEGHELPELHLLLSELPDGRWHAFLMELPWGGRQTENSFDSAEEACAAVDRIYDLCAGLGVWRVKRWGWDRPGPPTTDGIPQR